MDLRFNNTKGNSFGPWQMESFHVLLIGFLIIPFVVQSWMTEDDRHSGNVASMAKCDK